ncbi:MULTISPECIES: hypothetical protein [unclassified Tardiphaga]|uniref:hypothetical protein n=1 Tax=unclassified Tardiphaga TaxID=2631404 RepID=UPI003F248ABC
MTRRGTFRVIDGRSARAVATAALLALGLGLPLGGCASSIADMPMVGTPAGAPARPAEVGTYLPVHDLPTTREGTAMAPADQAKMQAELTAARDRQAVVLPAKPAAK